VRKSRYQFLSRKEREAIDFINEELMLGLLESGDVRTFNTIIAVIQDLKDVAGMVSADQEKCLRLPLVLFEAAVRSR
jgi:anti-sigma-K factor RskA